MTVVHFITHPEVVVDAAVPVPEWPLSPLGIRRIRLALERPWLAAVRAVFSSTERKATDAARVIGNHLRLAPVAIANLGENDRSATGYLPQAEFEAVADEFFARPDENVRGWERAADAQRRIVEAVGSAIAMAPATGDLAIISHGGVGALLLCSLKGVGISRREDQPGAGGGNLYSFDATSRQLLKGWRRIEDEGG